MNEKLKILLGSESLVGNENTDIFLNLELKNKFQEIRNNIYNNNFDVSEQFNKERNNSRNFRIYGSINSVINDCDNLFLYIYENSGLTTYLGSIKTTDLGYNQNNIYDKKRGKYLIELNNYSGNSIFIFLSGNSLTYGNQTFEQKLVFYDRDNNFVSYGTETIEINNDGTTYEINNNFPFFYNKHWIKKEINIEQEPLAHITFTAPSSSIIEGSNIDVIISLDKPSPFGNESVVFVENTPFINDYILTLSGTQITLPYSINFNPGEQDKIFNFSFPNDNLILLNKIKNFSITSLTSVDEGLYLSHNMTIIDNTEQKKINFNIGNIYQNRLYFTGRGFLNASTNYSSYSILRNGINFSRSNLEFYPNDNFILKIVNKGNDTIIPVNTDLNITPTPIQFLSGETKTFNLNSTYSGNTFHTIKLKFNSNPLAGNMGILKINGIRYIPKDDQVLFEYLSYNTTKFNILSASTLIPEMNGFESDCIFIFNDANNEITIRAKSPGTYIHIDIFQYNPIFTPNEIVVEEVVPYGNFEQISKNITLLANAYNNTTALYDFIIEKSGYRTLNIPGESIIVNTSVLETYYLTSGISNILRNWNNSSNSPFYNTATTESINFVSGTNHLQQNYFKMPIGNAFISGIILLSDAKPSLEPNYVKRNETNYGITGITSMSGRSKFFIGSLLKNPETYSTLNTVNVKQKSRLLIPALSTLEMTQNRGFSFQFGPGTVYNFYRNYTGGGNAEKNALHWWNNNVKSVSHLYSIPLREWIDVGNAYNGQPVGQVSGFSPGTSSVFVGSNFEITLESKTAGIPFNIFNIIHGNLYFPDHKKTKFEEIYPNGIANTTINKANNKLGGFNTSLIF